MKIGIDAKWFFSGPVSNQVVVRNLVENLVRENPGHELYFFLNKKHRNLHFPFVGPQIKTVFVWAGNNMISNLFLLPFWGKKLGLDGILYQNFGSILGPKPWVYIHDVIYLSHPEFFSLPERLYFSLMPFLSRFADKIITISESEKKRMQAYGLGNRTEISVLHHGKEPEFKPAREQNPEKLEAVRQQYQLPAQYLLYVGRLNARKNIGRLLQAVNEIPNAPPLVIVGEADWKSESGLRELLEKSSRENKVMLLGKVPFSDLPSILCMAEIFCFPSLAEGFGLPVLEAMASGVPVLTSKDSAMSEVCAGAAILVDPFEPRSIRAGISELLENPEIRKEMSEKGLERAKEFDWKKTAQKLFQILES